MTDQQFQLDAFVRIAQSQNERAKAQADYAYRMAEVAELWVKVEFNRERLEQIKLAAKRYQRQLVAETSRVKWAAAHVAQIERAIKGCASFSKGQWLDYKLVSNAWRSFNVILGKVPISAHVAILKLPPLTRSHLAGNNWSYNREPNSLVVSFPESVGGALGLFDNARRLSLMPRQGSPPMELLFEVLTIAGGHAESAAAKEEAELAETQARRDELLKTDWKKIDALTGASQ